MRIATDVGGTFTDLVYFDVDKHSRRVSAIRTRKVDSTPPAFDRGVMAVLDKAEVNLADCEFFVHGSTAVINAITERKGAKTALITTRGFRDLLEIARGNRPALFDFRYQKPAPFVPRHLRQVVTERMDHKGNPLKPVALRELSPIVDYLRAEAVEAIAICFLHAYANPAHEIAVARRIAELWPDVTVMPSHSITREWRDYERTNTAVLSAYVAPLTRRYLSGLDGKLRAAGLKSSVHVMRSNGGADTLKMATATPISILESGPAGGMLGAAALGERIGARKLIALDVGGTTAKCSLIEDSQVRITTQYTIERTAQSAGYPLLVPAIDIVEIGQGGGSIAWIDDHGGLHVGPKSAGAVPGPAAYGRGGTDFTTTDANLLAGRIDPEFFLGGAIRADMTAARAAAQRLGDALGLSVEETARGVLRFANDNMVNALKLVSLNRGYDPRDFTLVAFGGGGGMHAAWLASDLGIPNVIIPVNSAVFSALGMLMSDQRRDYVRTKLTKLTVEAFAEVGSIYESLETQAAAELREDALAQAAQLEFHRFADMRYQGQEHSVKVPFPPGRAMRDGIEAAIAAFASIHKREYTYVLENPIELVNYHVVAIQRVAKPELAKLPKAGRSVKAAVCGQRRVDFDVQGVQDTVVYDRGLLGPGHRLDGPAVVREPDTTIVVPPSHYATVDDYGNLHIAPRLG